MSTLRTVSIMYLVIKDSTNTEINNEVVKSLHNDYITFNVYEDSTATHLDDTMRLSSDTQWNICIEIILAKYNQRRKTEIKRLEKDRRTGKNVHQYSFSRFMIASQIVKY